MITEKESLVNCNTVTRRSNWSFTKLICILVKIFTKNQVKIIKTYFFFVEKFCKFLLICKIGKIMLDINREITANIGIVIRRLRREKGITQKQLSSELGISVAYINLIENNRRDITVPLLIKVAKLFNIELSDLTSDYNKQLNSDLMDIFSDTIFEEHDLKNIDIKDFSMNSPIVGDAVRSLYKKYLQNKKRFSITI